ncbi:MAG TPA: hypothetical protein PK355_05285, partial [Chitinophagales bacterium]|nr:hypothetical protein [Chitinophagales bacterium]
KDLRILRDQAETLKIRYGSAIPSDDLRNKHVAIQSEGTIKTVKNEVSLLTVSKIISARVKEILAHVTFQIKFSKFEKKLIGGIVLTGGGSQLKHLVQLTEMETGQTARLGFPREHLASTKISDVENPIYATGIGLLVRGFKLQDEEALFHQDTIASTPVVKEEIKIEAEGVKVPIAENETIDLTTELIASEPVIEGEKEEVGTPGPRKAKSIFSRLNEWIKSDVDDFDSK